MLDVYKIKNPSFREFQIYTILTKESIRILSLYFLKGEDNENKRNKNGACV